MKSFSDVVLSCLTPHCRISACFNRNRGSQRTQSDIENKETAHHPIRVCRTLEWLEKSVAGQILHLSLRSLANADRIFQYPHTQTHTSQGLKLLLGIRRKYYKQNKPQQLGLYFWCLFSIGVSLKYKTIFAYFCSVTGGGLTLCIAAIFSQADINQEKL